MVKITHTSSWILSAGTRNNIIRVPSVREWDMTNDSPLFVQCACAFRSLWYMLFWMFMRTYFQFAINSENDAFISFRSAHNRNHTLELKFAMPMTMALVTVQKCRCFRWPLPLGLKYPHPITHWIHCFNLVGFYRWAPAGRWGPCLECGSFIFSVDHWYPFCFAGFWWNYHRKMCIFSILLMLNYGCPWCMSMSVKLHLKSKNS